MSTDTQANPASSYWCPGLPAGARALLRPEVIIGTSINSNGYDIEQLARGVSFNRHEQLFSVQINGISREVLKNRNRAVNKNVAHLKFLRKCNTSTSLFIAFNIRNINVSEPRLAHVKKIWSRLEFFVSRVRMYDGFIRDNPNGRHICGSDIINYSISLYIYISKRQRARARASTLL